MILIGFNCALEEHMINSRAKVTVNEGALGCIWKGANESLDTLNMNNSMIYRVVQ